MDNEIKYKLTEQDYKAYLRQENYFRRKFPTIPDTEMDIILSDTLFAVIRNYNKDKSTFSRYIYYTIYNKIRKYFDRKGHINKVQVQEYDLATDTFDMDIILTAEKVINNMPKLHIIIFNHWLNNESVSEISKLINMSRYRVSNILNTVIVKLRKEVWGIY